MSYSNGLNGVGKGHAAAKTEWKLGLVNCQNKYLTAETFGFKINASGASLKKKQLWYLEHDASDENIVYIRSHLNRYLSADKRGNVKCDSEDKGSEEKFIIHYASDGSGRWSIQNQQHGYYFGGTDDALKCYEKSPTMTEWWTVRLAVHPQVNLKSVHRKKYAHLENDEIHVNTLIPWGQDALITLEFYDGKYLVRTCDNRYLHREGNLVSATKPAKETLYTLEIKSGQYSGMALKDCTGKYLTAVGPTGTMQSRDKPQRPDIVFTLEDSHSQVFITAHNNKKVSSRQGIDLSANQEEVEDQEIFQVEFDKNGGRSGWRLRTTDNKYWSLEQASGIQAVGDGSNPGGLFQFEYLDDANNAGKVAITASNGKYVTAKLNGSLYATSDSIGEREVFNFTIINRPILVLRCDSGFLGFKTSGSTRVECNKSSYDIIYLEHSDGKSPNYYMKGNNGKYWVIDKKDGSINAEGADQKDAQAFRFELVGQSKFYIKTETGMYLRGEQNGLFMANATKDKATQWEF